MNNKIAKENCKLVKTTEVSLDHPDTNITVGGQEFTISFKVVKIYFYEEINEENAT